MPPVKPRPSTAGRPTALGVHIFAGGFSLGVRDAGFDLLGHLEDSPYGVETVRRNFPGLDVRVGDGAWREDEYAGRVDLLYSNPPCAIFSSAGISTTRGPDAWRQDSRLGCWRRAFRVFAATSPRVFALESVCQAYTKGRPVVDSMTRAALAMGYSVVHLMEDARWCGVPQSRKRFFLVCYRPELPLTFRFDWSDPPTVGDVLATAADDPGDYESGKSSRGGANPSQWIAGCEQGQRLSSVFDLRNPSPELNHLGKRRGRPSFNCRRLHGDETMGAFVGNFYAHPTEDRFVGTREMRALCGYPLDYWLEGAAGGHASLLARAVLPPVGRWLASRVGLALKSAEVGDRSPTIRIVDLRRPPGESRWLTSRYLPGGPLSDGEDFLTPEEPSGAEAGGVEETGLPAEVPPPQAGVRPSSRPAGVDSPIAGGPESPLPDEGSGQLIRRLWMTGRYTPERLVELVHANWEGRSTRVSDVHYNYKKLLEVGTAGVPPWPIVRVGRARDVVLSTATAAVPASIGGRTVLIVGSSAVQVDSRRTALGLMSNMESWKAALTAVGYAVDWRAVRPGEDLSGYAAVIASLSKPNSIASNYVHGALWALATRPDAVVAVDDWQVGELVAGLRTCGRSAERLFRLRGSELPDDVRSTIYQTVEELAGTVWRWPVLVPTLGDGDPSLLGVPADEVLAVDPTAFARRYPTLRVSPARERRWVQASLLRKSTPVDLTWPVVEYGNSNRGEGGIGPAGADAQPRVREEDLMAVYAASWGVLSPAHPHAGSGWWRVRYLMAADAGCVLSADPREAACLGEPYVRASDPAAVERLGDVGLRMLANAQRRRLAEVAWPRERVLEVLGSLIQSRMELR